MANHLTAAETKELCGSGCNIQYAGDPTKRAKCNDVCVKSLSNMSDNPTEGEAIQFCKDMCSVDPATSTSCYKECDDIDIRTGQRKSSGSGWLIFGGVGLLAVAGWFVFRAKGRR